MGEVQNISGPLRILLAKRDGSGVRVGLAAPGGRLLRLHDQVDRLDQLVEVPREGLVLGLHRDRQPGELTHHRRGRIPRAGAGRSLRVHGELGTELPQHVLAQVKPKPLAQRLFELSEALAALRIGLLDEVDDLVVQLARVERQHHERGQPGGQGRQGLDRESRMVEQGEDAPPGLRCHQPDDGEHRVVLDAPLDVDPLQAVEPELGGLRRKRRQRGDVEEPDGDRLEAVRPLQQRGPYRMIGDVRRLAVERLDDQVGLAREDQVALLDPPSGLVVVGVERAAGFLDGFPLLPTRPDHLHEPHDRGPIAAARDDDELDRLGVVAPVGGGESLPRDELEQPDQLGRLDGLVGRGRLLHRLDDLGGEVLHQRAELGVVEQLVRRRVLPGRLVGVESVEFEVEEEVVVLRHVAGEGCLGGSRLRLGGRLLAPGGPRRLGGQGRDQGQGQSAGPATPGGDAGGKRRAFAPWLLSLKWLRVGSGRAHPHARHPRAAVGRPMADGLRYPSEMSDSTSNRPSLARRRRYPPPRAIEREKDPIPEWPILHGGRPDPPFAESKGRRSGTDVPVLGNDRGRSHRSGCERPPDGDEPLGDAA